MEEERDNYKRGLLKAKGKSEGEAEENGEKTVGDLVKEEIAKGLAPIIQQSLKSVFDNALNSISANPDEQKLIQYVYDNQIVHSGQDAESIKRDLENAQAIANKQKLKVITSEANLSRNNMAQMPNQSAGSSTQGQEVKDNFVSPEMMADIRARGMNLKNSTQPNLNVDDFVKRAIENLKRI